MKIVINESQLDKIIFQFLEHQIKDYPKEKLSDTLIVYGEPPETQLGIDTSRNILYVRPELYELVMRVFSLTNTPTKKVFKDFMETKGYKVEKIV
jgi:hypothetical protein